MARVTSQPGQFPHVKWIDVRSDGILCECAVVNEDVYGNVYFFELSKLDAIDKQRIFKVLTKRDADKYPLWDLLSNTTLGNGMNALDYFHQLVKVLTPSGKITNPRAGQVGFGEIAGRVDTNAPVADGAETKSADDGKKAE